MVEGGEVEEFDQTLANEWAQACASQPTTSEFLQSSQKRLIGGDQFVAFFNKRLDINRFFVADSNTEGATPDMPKVESGAGTGEDNGDDPFENSLEDALCVFKSGGGDTDILKDNER